MQKPTWRICSSSQIEPNSESAIFYDINPSFCNKPYYLHFISPSSFEIQTLIVPTEMFTQRTCTQAFSQGIPQLIWSSFDGSHHNCPHLPSWANFCANRLDPPRRSPLKGDDIPKKYTHYARCIWGLIIKEPPSQRVPPSFPP